MNIRCPSGNVKELVMELIFEGLATLHVEDNMPVKFQKIHEEWVCFDQIIGRFKNDIKEGRTRTYNISIWLGSDKEPKKLIDSFMHEWEEARANVQV